MRESTKKAIPVRRFGARLIGIVTGANHKDGAAWDALADCELAEFRADTFLDPAAPSDAGRLRGAFLDFLSERDRRGLSFGTLLTLRLRRDGGAWPDAEADRRPRVWESLGCAGPDSVSDRAPDWIDIEIEEWGRLPSAFRNALAASGIEVLLSHHDFSGCPPRDRLRALLRDMLAFGPAGVKFAVTCGARPEVLDLMAFAREAAAATPASGAKPVIAGILSMGAAGRAMRVLGPVLGCPLAYGFLTGSAVAPGQLSAAGLGRRLDDFSASLPGDLLAPGAEPRLLDWAEARLQGEPA